MLTGPGTSFTGVVSNGVVVFDFTSININNSNTVTATGSNPFALLSQTNFTLGGTSSIVLIGSDGASVASGTQTGGAGGPGGPGGGGGGSGGSAPGAGATGASPGGS